MLIPPPPPRFTLAPGLVDLPMDRMEAVERCLAGLAGKLPGVLVTGVRVHRGQLIIELESKHGAIVVTERLDEDASDEPVPAA